MRLNQVIKSLVLSDLSNSPPGASRITPALVLSLPPASQWLPHRTYTMSRVFLPADTYRGGGDGIPALG